MHRWQDDFCPLCGCRREWFDFIGYARFTWQDGRILEPKGRGAPKCEGFSRELLTVGLTAFSSAEQMSPTDKVRFVMGAYEDFVAGLKA